MVKVEYAEKFWKSIDGKKTIDKLTVLVDGKEAYVFDRNTIEAYAQRGDGALNTIRLHLLGTIRALKLSEEDEELMLKDVLKKMQSYKL